MAERNLPVVHSPAPMMGATAPVTPAGSFALGNAEVLSGLVIHQPKRPGAPFVYGVQAHHLDMRSTISVYGAPEYQAARVLNAAMGRFYGLPVWGNAGMTDSCALDEQAASDVAFSVLVAVLTGTHLAHDVGYMESGLTTSPELIRLSAEVIAMARKFADGIHLDAESLALEVIHAVGPGGDFLSADHTLAHFREIWRPQLFSRQRKVGWLAAGGKRLGERLKESTIALMADHRPEPLPGSIRDELAYIMKGLE
jgi:trimethylamine--corrinoid protein Co-methyltransferase